MANFCKVKTQKQLILNKNLVFKSRFKNLGLIIKLLENFEIHRQFQKKIKQWSPENCRLFKVYLHHAGFI